MEDLFNLNTDDFTGKAASQRKTDDNIYNPGPDQGQNGIYKSIIRFIPWVGDPSKSKYKKYAAKLINPLTNERLLVDCPSTNGSPSILWSLDMELKKLAKEEPSIVEEIKKYYNRYHNFYSCIYIKKDPQYPNMEGKIKIYSYGYTIDNLIQQEINPESELMTIQKVNPFSLTAGKDFVLVIKRKTKAWRDFSSSKFMSEVSPLIITTQGKEIPTSNDPKVMQFVSKYFKENSPDLSQYFYKDWTDYEYEKVAEYIKAIVPYKQIIDNLVGGLKDERMKKHFTNTKSISRTVAPAGESLEFTPAAPQTKGTSISIDIDSDVLGASSTKPTAAPAKPEVDELDSIFNDL